jgi:hypothetical protein
MRGSGTLADSRVETCKRMMRDSGGQRKYLCPRACAFNVRIELRTASNSESQPPDSSGPIHCAPGTRSRNVR